MNEVAVSGPNPIQLLRKEQHRLFVEEYCTGAKLGKPFNAVKAAEAAGYASPEGYSPRLSAREDIRAAIAYRLSQLTMSKEEVLARFTALAKSEVGEVLERDPLTGVFKINPDKLESNKKFLKSFGYDSNGNPKYEFHDAHAALRDLAKAHGLFRDETTAGGNVTVNMTINFVLPGQAPGQLPPPNSAVNGESSHETIEEGVWEEEPEE